MGFRRRWIYPEGVHPAETSPRYLGLKVTPWDGGWRAVIRQTRPVRRLDLFADKIFVFAKARNGRTRKQPIPVQRRNRGGWKKKKKRKIKGENKNAQQRWMSGNFSEARVSSAKLHRCFDDGYYSAFARTHGQVNLASVSWIFAIDERRANRGWIVTFPEIVDVAPPARCARVYIPLPLPGAFEC